MFVKICGITNIDDALSAAEYGASAVGFNFYRESKRYLSPETAYSIIRELPDTVRKIGVFVNADPEFVKKTAIQSDAKTGGSMEVQTNRPNSDDLCTPGSTVSINASCEPLG